MFPSNVGITTDKLPLSELPQGSSHIQQNRRILERAKGHWTFRIGKNLTADSAVADRGREPRAGHKDRTPLKLYFPEEGLARREESQL